MYNINCNKKYEKMYNCIDCGTKRYLIYPFGNETLIICSACYRIRKETEYVEQEIIYHSTSKNN